MSVHTVTFDLPENVYLRLQQAAQATKQRNDTVRKSLFCLPTLQ